LFVGLHGFDSLVRSFCSFQLPSNTVILMDTAVILLGCEAVLIYILVLSTHALRHRVGLGPFYALLGGMTAIMSWVTDAGLQVEVAGFTLVVGSTVFYTSLLLGVFVVYVFDGPRAARIAILTVAGMSIITPVTAALLQAQLGPPGGGALRFIPDPSFRINVASVLTTIADMVFLAMAWEFLGARKLKLRIGTRSFVTLLGVLWLDVVLFATGAFAGTGNYVSIMAGTIVTRFAIALYAWPFLYLYMRWENQRTGTEMTKRPVLAIVTEMAEVQEELSRAEKEIERRKRAEAEKEEVINKLQKALERVRHLEGLLPVCSGCKRIRIESQSSHALDDWVTMEDYVRDETDMEFSHDLCPECTRQLYPDVAEKLDNDASDGTD
jgi:hypothetical protein